MYQQSNQFANYYDSNGPNYFQTPSSHNFQQTNENQLEKKLPKSRQRIKANSRILPQAAIDIMTQWYAKHYSNPYPSFRDCELMANQGQITLNQVKQWFVNVRRRTQNEFRKKRCPYDTKNKRKLTDDNNQIYEELSQPKKTKIESLSHSQLTEGYNFTNFSNDIYNPIQQSTTSPAKQYHNPQYSSAFDATPLLTNPVSSYSYSNYYSQYANGYNYFSQSSPSISSSSNSSSDNSMYYQSSPIIPPVYESTSPYNVSYPSCFSPNMNSSNKNDISYVFSQTSAFSPIQINQNELFSNF